MSRIGVFVCHCGLNIAKTVRVSELAEFAATLPDVVVAKDYKFMCSTPGQEMIANDIREHRLDRVIVTACSPLMHEQTFRKVLAASGLNQYLLTIVNIREPVSYTHLRAHETVLDLVCRLLLEKKKKHNKKNTKNTK